MSRWTKADLQRLADKGVKVEGLLPTIPKAIKKLKKEPVGLTDIKQLLTILGITYEVEHRFNEYRKFRFDVAIMDHKIAIEYEGIFSAKSRHTSIEGYNRDTEKYNLAVSMGWRVMRYTAKNYKECIVDLKKMNVI